MNYITQKGVLRHFRDTKYNELDVFVSFVGYFNIPGMHSSTRSFHVLEPQKLTLRFDDDGLMSVLLFNDIDNENPNDATNGFFGSYLSANSSNNPLYPLNHEIVDNFERSIDILNDSGNKVSFELALVERLKFFKTLKDAELNFVILLRNHLDNSNLISALSIYDRIVDKHSIDNPANLLKSV